MRRALVITLLLAATLTTLPTAEAQAEIVTRLVNNGPSANRVDIAVVGDGYGVLDLLKYRTDVSRLVTGLFSQEPFREYQRYFNVTRIDVLSLQSGADHPERVPPRIVDTAFDSTYNCGNITRLICANTSKVEAKLNEVLQPDEHDLAIVLVNDAAYGGSGGNPIVVSAHEDLVELVLHEFGHSFGLLADEYGGSPTCSSTEPVYPNVTKVDVQEDAKWSHWLGVTGLHEGANHCDVGVYRSTPDSKMRVLGRPFEAVNTEQLVRRTYAYVSPIDSAAPAEEAIPFVPGGVVPLSVSTLSPSTHALDVEWFIDDASVGTGSIYSLDLERLTAGHHEITASVSDRTPWVRQDTDGLLSEYVTWTVDVPAHTRTYRSTDDGFVSSARKTTNFGASSQVRAATARTVTRTYLKFNVAGLTGAPSSARLRLRVNEGSVSGGEVRAVSDTTWTERRVTYRRAPSMAPEPLATVGPAATGDVVEFDVTSAISGNGIYSFALVSDSRDQVSYSSDEGIVPPTLVIDG
jgi:hypothetical protein